MRQTVSWVGADEDDVPAFDELLDPELQPAIASAVAAQNATNAAGVFLSLNAGSFPRTRVETMCLAVVLKLTGKFPIK